MNLKIHDLINNKGESAVIEYYLPQILLRLVKDLRSAGCINTRITANLLRKVLNGGEVTDKIDVRYVLYVATQLAEKTESEQFVLFLERVFRQIQLDAALPSGPLINDIGDTCEPESEEGD
jgi:hypothetical protein